VRGKAPGAANGPYGRAVGARQGETQVLPVPDSDHLHLLRAPGAAPILFDSVSLEAFLLEPSDLGPDGEWPCVRLRGERDVVIAARRRGFARKPGHINTFRVVLTESCNFACRYCFETTSARRPRSMSKRTLERTVQVILDANAGQGVAVHWFGGEPLLLWSHIDWAMASFAEAARRGQISSVHHSMTTNGSLVTPRIARDLARARCDVFVSVDGPRAVNDRSRVDRSGGGTFDEALRGFRLLAQAGVDVGLLVTADASSVSTLFESVRELIETVGVRKVGVNTPQPSRNGWSVDGAVLAEQMHQLVRYCNDQDVRLLGPGLRVLRALKYANPHVDDCRSPSGAMAATITPEGQLSGCIVSWQDGRPWKLRDLSSRSLLELEHIKVTPTVQPGCHGCIAEMVCGGPCALEMVLAGVHPDRCAFYRTFVVLSVLESTRDGVRL